MCLVLTRLPIRLIPDYKKVIPRFFNPGNERSLLLIKRIMQISNVTAANLLESILNEFSNRYKNVRNIFSQHFERINSLIDEEERSCLTEEKRLLIGAYLTMEYSFEAAAIFNPSVVEDPDQSGINANEKKVIISFRATGESHISSLVFKSAVLKENGTIELGEPGKFMREGEVVAGCLNQAFFHEAKEENGEQQAPVLDDFKVNYRLNFNTSSLLSERVIFPVIEAEKNGIEDARFTKFVTEEGTAFFIATYTAYDGISISPRLIITKDFLHFEMSALYGKKAINKNLALFPRKIKGKYVMLSRIDGMNNYIMFSDDLYTWEEAKLWQQPEYPWEFVQVGNAGSPIETEKGWLVITHGVGPMRKYCLGASLFDLDDPTIELGRLKEPLLMPDEDERNGYVPNVVYSCGSIIHGEKLFIPYAVSDYASTFATVPLKELLDEILQSHNS